MKKEKYYIIVTVVILILVAFIFVFYKNSVSVGKVNGAKTHEVESKLYTQKDITEAIEVVKKAFSHKKGCTLTEIYYAGDDESTDYQDWADRNGADEVLVLESSFDAGFFCDGSLNPNSTYPGWNWILVRNKGEKKWQLVDQGY